MNIFRIYNAIRRNAHLTEKQMWRAYPELMLECDARHAEAVEKEEMRHMIERKCQALKRCSLKERKYLEGELPPTFYRRRFAN